MNRPSRSTRSWVGATSVPLLRGIDVLRKGIVVGGLVVAAALANAASAEGALVGSLTAVRFVAGPGETLTIALRLESLGSTWTAAPTFESPAGWDLVWAPVPVELASAAPAVVLATLRVDPAAAAGDHPIAFEVRDPRSGRRHRFEGVVAVPAVHAVEVAATGAPASVVDGAYEAHFVLRNVGNVPLDVRLDARATFGFDAVARPARALLPIGGVLPIVVAVRSPAAWNRTETVVATLTAHADGAAPATARSATEVLARPSSWAGAWQVLPLTLRFSVEVRSDGVAFSHVELRGAGAADDRGLGHLSVHYRAPIDDPLTPDDVRLSYRRSSWALTVGDVALSRAGFGEALAGRGAAAEGRWTLPAGGRVDASVGVVGTGAGAAVGASGRFSDGGGAVTATGLLGVDEALFAVRATHVGAVPAVGSGAALVSGTVAYAVGARRPEDGDAWTVGHAAEARAAFGSALGRLELGQSIVTAPFAGTAVHRAVTDLRVTMRTGAWWPDGPVASPTWSARYVAVRTWGDAAPTTTVHEATWLVATSFGGLRVALGHVAGWGDGPQKQVSHAEGSASLGGVAVAQRLEWRHATATEPVARLGWRSDVAGPAGAGRWSVRLEALATVEPWTLDDVHLGATWSTPLAEAIDARIRADWRPLADRSIVALAGGMDADLGRGRTLELGVAAAWHRTGPPSLAASAAFTVPLSVPVSRRSDVGTVRGRLVDGAGAPVAGATLRLGGAAAVTDGDGRFILVGAPAGSGAIVADLATLPYAHPVWTASPVTVQAGATTEVALRVVAGGAVDGHLRFVAGDDALPGVDRLAAARWWTGATVTLSRDGGGLRSATVGADGAFRLCPLEPGTWLVAVAGSRPADDAMAVSGASVTVVAGAVAALVLDVRPVHRRVRFQDEVVPTLRVAPR